MWLRQLSSKMYHKPRAEREARPLLLGQTGRLGVRSLTSAVSPPHTQNVLAVSYRTDIHWDSTFRVPFDTAWLSLVSSETSCILSDPAVCSSPQHMPTVWTPRQCCSHHWKVMKTDLRKYFLSLFFHYLSLFFSFSVSFPLPLSQFCNSTNYSFKPRAFLLSASLQNMILKRILQ